MRNYYIGLRELGLDCAPMEAHFTGHLGADRVASIRAMVERERENPFDFFDAVYCINRDADAARWQTMQQRFARLGIRRRVQRFAAVDTPWNHHIGCALSHRAIVADARERGLRNVFVFEDDAMFLEQTLPRLDENLDDLAGTAWDVFHLGGCKWGREYPKVEGCRRLERASLLTCTHAVAYNHTVFDRLLREIPADIPSMQAWVAQHAAIDQYLNVIERRFITWPVLSTQPGLLPQEHPDYRDLFIW